MAANDPRGASLAEVSTAPAQGSQSMRRRYATASKGEVTALQCLASNFDPAGPRTPFVVRAKGFPAARGGFQSPQDDSQRYAQAFGFDTLSGPSAIFEQALGDAGSLVGRMPDEIRGLAEPEPEPCRIARETAKGAR